MSDQQNAAAMDLGSNLAPAPAPAPAPEDKPAKPPRAPKKAAPKKAAPVGMPESVWIILEENDDIPPTGLFIGHNGDSFLIRTGVPLHVPLKILAILDDAIKTVPLTDPVTMRVVGSRDRMRYPYRRVAAPVDTE